MGKGQRLMRCPLLDYWPVPESLTFCGLPEALWVMVRAPGMVPACAGVKVTSRVQVLCALTVVPQGFFPPGTAENCPLAAMPLRVSVLLWLLVIVRVLAALVLPMLVKQMLETQE